MKRWGVAFLGMGLILGALAWVAGTEPQAAGAPSSSPPDGAAAKAIWAGKSGDFAIRWTTADIQARPLKRPGRAVFSAAQLAHRGFQRFISPPHLDGSEKHITYERKFTLLSVVGSIVSLRDELYYEITPSAHPGGETRFIAIDLAKPGEVPDQWATEEGLSQKKLGKVATLTDFFPEKEVFQALLANPLIREQWDPTSPPRTLGGFFPAEITINEIHYGLPADFLSQFAFHHLQGNQVAIHLGMWGYGAFRSAHAQLTLLLPIPPALKNSLALAASGQEGFLLADRKKIAGEDVTRISFSFEGKGKVKKR